MLFGFNSASELIMFIIVIAVSLTIHEYSHALVSYLQGDPTAKNDGRLTLNPAKHVDLFGVIAMLIIHFGWAKPVPTNSSYYKNRRLGMIFTSLAGPLSNLLFAFIAALVFVFVNPDTYILGYFFYNLISINIILAIFNIIPIPPLDGSKILASLFGGIVEETIYRIERIGMFLVFALFLIPQVSDALSFTISYLTKGVINTAALIILHQQMF